MNPCLDVQRKREQKLMMEVIDELRAKGFKLIRARVLENESVCYGSHFTGVDNKNREVFVYASSEPLMVLMFKDGQEFEAMDNPSSKHRKLGVAGLRNQAVYLEWFN